VPKKSDLLARLHTDLNESAKVVGDSELLGYQITIVMRGDGGSVLIAHAAVANDRHLGEVTEAIIQKTREVFFRDEDEDEESEHEDEDEESDEGHQ
jgi:hypothetical protein